MKKFLLSLATLALGFSAYAGVANFTFSEMGYENAQDVTTVTDGPISITFDLGSNSNNNAPKYYNTGAAVRVYGGNFFTVSSSSDEIKQIFFTFGSGDGTNEIITNNGKYDNGVWAGDEKSVVFTIDGTSGQRRLASISVTYGDTTPEVPNLPQGTLTVAQALEYLAAGGNQTSATVKGIISSITEISEQYGNATYIIKDNLDDENGLTVYRGKGLNGEPFTSTDQIQVGGTVTVTGEIMNYNGTYEFATGSSIVEYSAPEVAPDAPVLPEGTLTVAQALKYLEDGGIQTTATVKGIISSITEISTQYGNATYIIKDNLNDENGLTVYRGKGLNGEPFTSENEIEVGGTVTVTGSILNYNGTYEFTTGSSIVEYSAPEGGDNGDNTPDNPDTPEAPEGIITVSAALQLINDGYKGEATVEGYIISITEISTQYGNATYIIADNATDTEGLTIFRGKYFDGEKFTSEDQLEVGAKVVVKGNLVLYNDVTPEMEANNVLISYNGETSAPEGGNGGDEPGEDEPGTLEGENVAIDFTEPEALTAYYDGSEISFTVTEDKTEFDLTGVTITEGVVSISAENEGNGQGPRLFLGASANATWGYRFYKDNVITISIEEGYYINGIEFDATGLGDSSIVFTGDGSYNNGVWMAAKDSMVTEVVITKTATGNNPVISDMVVYYREASNGGEGDGGEGEGPSTGINGIDADLNGAVYYNLQGVRVNNPAKGGLYIIRQGDKTSKVVIR